MSRQLFMPVLPDPVAAALGSRFSEKRTLPPEITESHLITGAIAAIRRRWPLITSDADDDERPIFILSAGWGSGSTLLQRLVVSTGNCLVWGEPMSHSGPILRMARSIMPVSEAWPPAEFFEHPEDPSRLANSWIANLTPQIENLRRAHREFFILWLKKPALERGYEHWGLKEVRLTIDHAVYLRWLFPSAKFLFLYRDVKHSYRSCKGVNWYSVWPDYRVRDVSYFAHHWRYLLSGFLGRHHEVDGMLIRHEELVAGPARLDDIAAYLGIGEVDVGILSRRIGSRSKRHAALNRVEHYVLSSIAGKLRAQVGYAD